MKKIVRFLLLFNLMILMCACAPMAQGPQMHLPSNNTMLQNTTHPESVSTTAPTVTAPIETDSLVDSMIRPRPDQKPSDRAAYEQFLLEGPLPSGFVHISAFDLLAHGEFEYFMWRTNDFESGNRYRYVYMDDMWLVGFEVQHATEAEMRQNSGYQLAVRQFVSVENASDDMRYLYEPIPGGACVYREGVVYRYATHGFLHTIEWYINGCYVQFDVLNMDLSKEEHVGAHNDFVPGGVRYDPDLLICKLLSKDPEIFASAVAQIETAHGGVIDKSIWLTENDLQDD